MCQPIYPVKVVKIFFQKWKLIKRDHIDKMGGSISSEGRRISKIQNPKSQVQVDQINGDYRPLIRYDSIVLNKMSRVLLEGIYDPDCVFSMLRGCPHLLEKIWTLLVMNWRKVVQFPAELNKEDFTWDLYGRDEEDYTLKEVHPNAFFLAPIYPEHDFWGPKKERLRFPGASNININMMPFILERTFANCRLPENVRPYWDMIKACIRPEFAKADHHMWSGGHKTEVGKVCYLTIQESAVEKGASQRRPGLHTDHPGSVRYERGRKARVSFIK